MSGLRLPAGDDPLFGEPGPALMVAFPEPGLLPGLPTFSGLWALLRSPVELASLLVDPIARRLAPPGRRLLVARVDAALLAASIPFRTRGAGGSFFNPSLVSFLVGTGFFFTAEPIPQLLARETRLAEGWRLVDPDAPDWAGFSDNVVAPVSAHSDADFEGWLRRRHGEAFVAVPAGHAEARRFVAPTSLRVVDLYPDGDAPPGSAPIGQGVSALVIEGEDLPMFWADAMLRAEPPDRALALFERLDARQPVPIEVLPRVQRWWLPASGYLLELRGRGTLQSARLAPPDDGRRALSSMIAVATPPELELAFAGLMPVGALQMALCGAIWLERGPSRGGDERLRLASPETISAAIAQLPDLTSVSKVDALLSRLQITAVSRRETAGPGGRPRVEWRLRECGAILLWDGGLRAKVGDS